MDPIGDPMAQPAPRPNRWGAAAWARTARHQPRRLAAIPDPASYFSNLGEETDHEIRLLAEAITPPTSASDPFPTVLGRARMSRMIAEHEILDEILGQIPDPQDCPTDPTGAYQGHDPQMSPAWTPLWEGGDPDSL